MPWKLRPGQVFVEDDPEFVRLIRMASNRVGKCRDGRKREFLGSVVTTYGRYKSDTVMTLDQKAALAAIISFIDAENAHA